MRQRIINWLLRDLLNAILPDDVVTVGKSGIFIGGKRITDAETAQLRAEAKALRGFRLWSLMTNSVKHVSHDKIFNRSVNFDDVMAGKLMLLNLDTIDGIARLFDK